MLEIRDLVKVYPGPVVALSGLSLEIPNGLFGLLGPNGAGKSTLMRILAGLLAPTSGRILKNGRDVTDRPEALKTRLGYLPQDFGFYPELSGRAMLSHLLALKGVGSGSRKDRDRAVDELLERVNLLAAAARPIRTYSGGMRQRLGIAQAIAGDPEVIIVDEPTVGLDPEERLRFFHLLADLARHRPILFSTHLVEDVAALCPRFALILSGRLVGVFSPDEARKALEGKIFAGNLDPRCLPDRPGELCLIKHSLVEGRSLIRLFAAKGALPTELAPELVPAAPTLEDAYLVMTAAPQAHENLGLAA